MGRRISWRVRHVWERNFRVFVRTWKVSFLPPIFDSLFFLVALGYGLGQFVQAIDGVDYARFVAPAIVAIGIMNASYYETTYGSFVRMYYQKTFDAMLATPLFLEDIIAGEIVWGATKAVIATAIMQVILTLFGLIRYPEGLLILPLSFIAGFAFASIGMVFTAVVKHIDLFNLPIFLFVTPMFLFGGTFFPLETLPAWAQVVAWGLPLTHLVELARAVGFGRLEPSLLWHLMYLAVFSALFFPLALVKMRTRLIK